MGLKKITFSFQVFVIMLEEMCEAALPETEAFAMFFCWPASPSFLFEECKLIFLDVWDVSVQSIGFFFCYSIVAFA